LRDDLSSILNDDLVGLECSHSAHPIATIDSVSDLDTIVISITFGSAFELGERTIAALCCGESTVRVIAFVCHDTIVAGLAATIFWITVALRGILLVTLPQCRRIPDEPVYDGVSEVLLL
jgi:hypothetical protein